MFRSRIDVFAQGVDSGRYKKVHREQAYKAFSSLVEYDEKYHGMKEVMLDGGNFEAISLIEFRTISNDSDFEVNPYWIDNIAHLSGFVLNASDAVDSAKQVYISHGWESLQMICPPSSRRSYRNHVKMHRGPRQTMVGDVYVFDGEDMVALVGVVKFQTIPRSLLNKLLPPTSWAATYLEVEPPKSKKQPPPALIETTYEQTMSITHPRVLNASAIIDCMNIISEELGLEPSKFPGGAACADVGLDSLMSLKITGRMREQLKINVPTSLFVDNATISETKSAIFALVGDSSNKSTSRTRALSYIPGTMATMNGDKIAFKPPAKSTMANFSSKGTVEKFLGIISKELGTEQSELLETGNFADVGIDPLMSLTITGRIREELELDIPATLLSIQL